MRRLSDTINASGRLCALAMLALFLLEGAACAQKYKVEKISADYADPRKLKAIKRTKADVVRGKAALGPNRATLERYFNGYFFPAMSDPVRKGQLAAMRMELTNDLAMSTGEVHDLFLNIAHTKCRSYLLNSSYDPAVRYNCALLLGDLNEKEAVLKEAKPPVPYKPALGDLAKLFVNDKSDDAIIVASLIGIRRHTQLTGAKNAPNSLYSQPRVQSYLISKLGKFSAQSKAPKGRSDAAHQWMRQLAVESLGFLRESKSGAVAKLMMKIANQPESPIDLRCAAVEAMARLDLGGTQITGKSIVDVAGQVVFAACQAEVSQIADLIRAGFRRSSGGGRSRGREPDFGSSSRKSKEFETEDRETVPYRRRLIHELLCVKRALVGDPRAGIAGIQSMQDAGQRATDVIEIVDTVIEALEDGTKNLKDLGRSIANAKNKIGGLISQEPTSPTNRDA